MLVNYGVCEIIIDGKSSEKCCSTKDGKDLETVNTIGERVCVESHPEFIKDGRCPIVTERSPTCCVNSNGDKQLFNTPGTECVESHPVFVKQGSCPVILEKSLTCCSNVPLRGSTTFSDSEGYDKEAFVTVGNECVESHPTFVKQGECPVD